MYYLNSYIKYPNSLAHAGLSWILVWQFLHTAIKVCCEDKFFPLLLLWCISVACDPQTSQFPWTFSKYSFLASEYSLFRILRLSETGFNLAPVFLKPFFLLSIDSSLLALEVRWRPTPVTRTLVWGCLGKAFLVRAWGWGCWQRRDWLGRSTCRFRFRGRCA